MKLMRTSDKSSSGGSVRNGLCTYSVVSLRDMESLMGSKNALQLLPAIMPKHSMVSLTVTAISNIYTWLDLLMFFFRSSTITCIIILIVRSLLAICKTI